MCVFLVLLRLFYHGRNSIYSIFQCFCEVFCSFSRNARLLAKVCQEIPWFGMQQHILEVQCSGVLVSRKAISLQSAGFTRAKCTHVCATALYLLRMSLSFNKNVNGSNFQLGKGSFRSRRLGWRQGRQRRRVECVCRLWP
jgi:hypothetical protein